MWYIIFQILFIIIGCILAKSYNKYAERKYGEGYCIDYSVVFLCSLLWPLFTIIFLCNILYKTYLKEKLNKLTDKLSNIWNKIL